MPWQGVTEEEQRSNFIRDWNCASGARGPLPISAASPFGIRPIATVWYRIIST
jgi:hypothetical protein